MKLYFVRHGETAWNVERRMQGQSDIPLNEFGCELAVKTGKGMADIGFDKVYSSPLVRAYHTAELILAENKSSSNTEIITDNLIEEIGFGIYEGLCCSKEGWNMPDDNFKNFFQNCGEYKTPEGGEGFQDVMNRIGEFMKMLMEDNSLQDKTILIASHGALIRGVVNYITGNSISEYWKGGVHKNCAVTIVNYDGSQFKIEAENIVYYDDEVEDWYAVRG